MGANKVKDNALKYGAFATAKVVEVSQNVTEKVFILVRLLFDYF